MVSGYIKQYKRHPKKACEFFSKKLTTTWTDPLYESIFSGPKAAAGQYVKTKQLHHLFNEEKHDTYLYTGMKAYIILLLAAVWIVVIKYIFMQIPTAAYAVTRFYEKISAKAK